MLMNYGAVGLGMFIWLAGAAFLVVARFAKNNPYSKFVILTLLLLLSISLTAGHVVYSASAGYLIGGLAALGSFRHSSVGRAPIGT